MGALQQVNLDLLQCESMLSYLLSLWVVDCSILNNSVFASHVLVAETFRKSPIIWEIIW